jgi:hypothetical protein
MKKRSFSNFFLLFIVFFLSIVISVDVNTATITVSTTGDNAAGSLREAITAANTNKENNVIYLLAGTYYLEGEADDDDNLSGDFDISTSGTLMIIGAGKDTTIIDGNQADRVFHIISGDVSISNVTIRGGKTEDHYEDIPGSPNGGGIYNSGTLNLENCVIRNNVTGYFLAAASIHYGRPGGDGGGIYNNGTLTITNCLIENNNTSDSSMGVLGGAHGGDGGGIMNLGRLTINTSTIRNNKTGEKGVAASSDSGGHGGGIYSNGTTEMSNSTIASNQTGEGRSQSLLLATYGGDGGGIYIEKGTATLINCTISGNSTGDGGTSPQGGGGYGGGIAVNDGTLNIYNCTICSNFTGEGDVSEPPYKSTGYGGGIYSEYGSEIHIKNTIIADNQVPDNSRGPDCHGILSSSGYNLIENTEYGTFIGDTEKDITGVDPRLGPLQDNGGPGMTHALLPNSTAIDAGYNSYYYYDQRGYERPVDIPGIDNAYKGHDIGAYEYDSYPVPVITVNREVLKFSADTSGNQSPGQTFTITHSGSGTMNWEISQYGAWLSYSPASGTNSGTVTVTVDPSGLAPGTYIGEIRVVSYDAFTSTQKIKTVLNVYDTNAGSTSAPFGIFKTPDHGSTVMSSVPVTGWTLDDIGVTSVKIFRDPVPGEGSGKIFIGDAVFVEGARPDVEQAYPGYPMNYKAGWGYMMLTNFLPNRGNGTFTIYAIAADVEGNQVTLGSKTITCDNANAVKPFGAIDTPTQGGTALGSDFVNFGWALTPPPNSIPIDGSTIRVWVDGVSLGNPVYNRYREDIATLFPGYNNSSGAGGYFYLDTTRYENGVHTIQWTITDDAGNTDGIGSRYFSIRNGSQSAERTAQSISFKTPDISKIPVDYSQPMRIKKGYNLEIEPQFLFPAENRQITIEIKELERVEICLSEGITGLAPLYNCGKLSNGHWTGFQVIGSQLRSLPIGSWLDPDNGIFSWTPGPGHYGLYTLLFIKNTLSPGESKKYHIQIKILPQ